MGGRYEVRKYALLLDTVGTLLGRLGQLGCTRPLQIRTYVRTVVLYRSTVTEQYLFFICLTCPINN